MTSETVAERVARWASAADGEKFPVLQEHVEFLERKVFGEYEPTRAPSPDFLMRCRDWLDSAPDDSDQRIMFELIAHIHFFSQGELRALHRAAMSERVIPWVVGLLGIELDAVDSEKQLESALRRTWFCPITDSMQIAAFHHLNRAAAADLRPDWRSLREFGRPIRIDDYMTREGFDRLVLLEDFVGSGKQMVEAVEFAASTLGNLEILVSPLITCPQGAVAGRALSRKYSTVTFAPVIELRARQFVTPVPDADEPAVFAEFRATAQKLAANVKGTAQASEKWHGEFGYMETGSLVVLYSNCPDNTLPLVHRTSDTWNPLFPRAARI